MTLPDKGDARPLHLFPRRDVVKAGAVAAGGLAVGAELTRGESAWAESPHVRLLNQSGISTPGATPAGTPERVADYVPVALGQAEYATLIASIDRLIPTDDLGPGAGDSGVGIFLDSALTNAHSAYLEFYQGGLAALDNASDGGDFTAIDESEQDAILTRAEGGELTDMPPGFFGLLLEHTRHGMFGDPIYGGNRDFAGWDLVSYPGVKLNWTPEEQAIDTDVAPEHRSVADFGATPYTGA
jgi:hypothetical protein